MHFPVNAEPIEFKQGEKYNVGASKSESVKVLSDAAKTEGVWLLGGPHNVPSIPEKDPSDGKIYNTSTVYSPQGVIGPSIVLDWILIFAPGELIAIHRKVHLFDIDIPGKITFKVRTSVVPIWSHILSSSQESETLTGGSTVNYFDTGKTFSHSALLICS